MACHTYCNSLSVCTGGEARKRLLRDLWIRFHFLTEGEGLGFYYSALRMKIFFFIIKEKITTINRSAICQKWKWGMAVFSRSCFARIFPLPNRAVLTSLCSQTFFRSVFISEMNLALNRKNSFFPPLLNILHYSPSLQSPPTSPLRICNTGALN